MNLHQQKQVEVINQIEKQVNSNSLQFSTIAPVRDYENDPRIFLSSIHFPHKDLITKIEKEIINPLKEIELTYYYYPEESLHMTIKNIRVINDPPNFTEENIATAKQVLSMVIPSYHQFSVYFYRLLLFPNNLALIGTTDPELDNIILDLDKKLKDAGIPDDKKYTNSQYFFSNMTLVRFPNASDAFKQKVQELSQSISLDPYVVDSVSLVSANAALGKRQIFNTWELK